MVNDRRNLYDEIKKTDFNDMLKSPYEKNYNAVSRFPPRYVLCAMMLQRNKKGGEVIIMIFLAQRTAIVKCRKQPFV